MHAQCRLINADTCNYTSNYNSSVLFIIINTIQHMLDKVSWNLDSGYGMIKKINKFLNYAL